MATSKGVWDLQEVRDKQLASNWNYSADDPNALFAWGKNSYGVLGLNQPSNTRYSSPVNVQGTWTNIYHGGGGDTRWVAKASGSLYVWGNNGNHGVLGVNQGPGQLAALSSPTQVGTDTTWNKVWAGENYAIANKTDGTLWVWGSNDSGQLGQNQGPGQLGPASSPVQVGTDTTWTKSVVGAIAHAAIKTNGTLWVWGRNWKGGLGQNQNPASVFQVSSPTQVGTDTTWKTIFGTGDTFFAAKTNGTMWAWGRSWGGALGQNQYFPSDTGSRSSPTQIPGTDWAIVTGMLRGVSTKTDGTLWSWGYQNRGELGQNNNVKYSSPTQVGTDTTWPKLDAKFNNILNVPSMTGAIKTDGTLWLWGANLSGELGDNTIITRSSPVQIPGTWSDVQGKGYNGAVIARTPS